MTLPLPFSHLHQTLSSFQAHVQRQISISQLSMPLPRTRALYKILMLINSPRAKSYDRNASQSRSAGKQLRGKILRTNQCKKSRI